MGNVRGTSYYEIVTGPDWAGAESAANSLGGNLITINNSSESDYITTTYMANATNAYYIGLNSAASQGNWVWTSGETSDYSNWAPGTPNNQPIERYSIIGIITGWWDDWTNQQGNVTQGIAEVPLSYFSVSDLTVDEGDSASITVSRTGGTLSAQSLTVTSSNGTASNSDYSAINATISFASGETSKTITFNSTEDTSTENNETVTIQIEASGSDDVPAQISDGVATVTITDDDDDAVAIAGNQTYTYNVKNSTAYRVNVGSSADDDSNSENITIINVDNKFIGGASADVLKGYSGDNSNADLLDGGEGTDQLFGYRGADFLSGGNGNDELRAGNGRDIITGGDGGDTMYGGFGLNTFEDEADGAVDSLYFKSDQWEENWIYGKAGNSPNGEKADKIMELDPFDEIFVQGVETEELSFGNVVHYSNLGETLEGIGIYASGTLEAVYVGNDLSMGQIEAMTEGLTSW